MSMASFPESEELRNPSEQNKHISTGFYKKEKKKNPTYSSPLKFLNSSECIDYFGLTTVAQNTFFFFFAKWEVALDAGDKEVS